MTVLVTGATGTVGSRLVPLLGPDVRPVSRSTLVRFDWSDPSTHDSAFDGIDRLYLISPLDTTEPAALVAPVLERAVARGLRRVVLQSSSAVESGDPGPGELAALVHAVAPEPVVLRPSWFTQNLTGDLPPARGLRDGTVVTATGDGRVPFVDAGDIAAVAAVALTADPPPDPEMLVTGPEALSYADVCALWTELTGRPARHVAVPAAVLAERFTADGMDPGYAAFLAGLDELIASGAQADVSDTVRRLTGRDPRSVRAVLAASVQVVQS